MHNSKQKTACVCVCVCVCVCWLVGCFGFEGLSDSTSVYIGPSPKEREKEEERQGRVNMSEQPRTYRKRNKPLPYFHTNCRTP